MPDEVDIYARLESPFFGGLLQVLGTLSEAVGADCAAARAFNLDDAAIDCCVISARLGLGPAEEQALRGWPRDEGNLFELLRRVQPPVGICRPRECVDEPAYADRRLFRRLEMTHHVVDCLCQTVPLNDSAACLLCFIRCAPSLPFAEEEVSLLRRLHPTAQRVLQTALRREMHPIAVNALSVETVPLSRLLSRLSRTERQVLGYLRTALTERQIAEELERSYHTVHVHVKNIYRKFGISSRKQLVELFIDK